MAQSKVYYLEGNELADGYVRTHLPEGGRWSDAWDLLKKNFFKFVLINVITLIFLLPIALLLIYFRPGILSTFGVLYPFAGNAGLATKLPYEAGLAEQVTLGLDLPLYAVIIACGLLASVGISGALYSVRKMIVTHGQFAFKDYWHGVRVLYFKTLLPVTVFLTMLFCCVAVADWVALVGAQGGNVGGAVTAEVFVIIAAVLVGIYCCWFLAVGTSYKVSFKKLLKSSLTFSVSVILQTVFMLAFAFLPLWIVLIPVQFIVIIGYALFIFIGISSIILSWMAYAQWVFDAFIEPVVKTDTAVPREKMTAKQLEEARREEERTLQLELLAAGKSELIGNPIKPIDEQIAVPPVGQTFGRGDISRVQSDKAELRRQVEDYYNAHKDEPGYAEYNKMFADREKVVQVPDKKGKKKKSRVSADNLLR